MPGNYCLLLWIGVFVLLFRVAIKPSAIFEFPYFISAVFAAFILPQTVSLLLFPGRVSSGAVSNVLIVSCLCLAASVVGYAVTPSRRIVRLVARPVHPNRIFHVGLCFVALSLIFAFLLSRMEVQTSAAGGWTGRATIYLFFVGLAFPGFAILLLLALKQATPARIVAAVFSSIIPIWTAIAGRREPAVVLGLVILLSRFYRSRRQPPRLLIFGAIAFAALAIPATGTYRGLLKATDADPHRTHHQREAAWRAMLHMDLVGNFKSFVTQESILELRNAAAVIESTQRFNEYEWGAGYWNQIIFRFVPAQIVGLEEKQALMLGAHAKKSQSSDLASGFEISTGSTITGMGDSFKQFGWAGCLFFALLAMIFRSIWQATLVTGSFLAQVFYILICSSAMRTVTHQTVDFLPGLIYHTVFLGLGMLYAGVRRDESPSQAKSQPLKNRPLAVQRPNYRR